jgi:hypothetical protein
MMRRLDERDPHPISGTTGASQPRFSPDGRWLAFLDPAGALKRMPVVGGPSVTIGDSVGRYSWGDGDLIVVNKVGGGGVLRVLGGDGTPLAPLDTALKETAHTWPQILPGGKAMLFTAERGGAATGRLAAMRFSDRRVIRFDVGGENPRYVSSGHVLMGRLDGSVVAVPFDVGKLRVTGPAATALASVVVKSGGASEFAVSPAGTLVYVEGILRQQLVVVDRSGAGLPLMPGSRRLATPRFSPSGDKVALMIADDGAKPKTDIWILNVASKQLSRLTNDGRSIQPEWTPDGKRIVWIFTGDSNQVRTQAWDGSGRPETIPTPGHSFNAVVPSPLGGTFASSQFSKPPHLPEDIWITSMTGGATSRVVVQNDADEYMPRLSSDGKWLAYYSNPGTNYEVYVTPADGSGSPHQISTNGGAEPMWSPSGLTLFYRSLGRLMAARITSASPFEVSIDTLFVDAFGQDQNAPAYDVARDGQHFLMLRFGDQRERVVVTMGWFDELRARTGQVSKK